jgi:hypothetical protein
MEVSFGKTKLVKLLYLIDLEFYRLYSRKLTEFEWVFYYYGPYAYAIDDVLKQLDLDIPQEVVVTAAGHKANIFKFPKYLTAEFEDKSSNLQKSVVDRILNEWGPEELNPLLSYVYFHTEPMQDAQRGEILDFSKISRPSLQTVKKTVQIPEEQTQNLRRKFKEIKKYRLRSIYQSLNPKPRFDDVFMHSLVSLESDEQYFVPKGEIEIDNDFKEQIRQQTQ